jgi:hypothetical protein
MLRLIRLRSPRRRRVPLDHAAAAAAPRAGRPDQRDPRELSGRPSTATALPAAAPARAGFAAAFASTFHYPALLL